MERGKKRGSLRINESLTPIQNINEMIKTIYPVELSLEKLQSGQSLNDHGAKLRFKGIEIYPTDSYGEYAHENERFKRVAFHASLSGRTAFRRSRRQTGGFNTTRSIKLRDNGEIGVGNIIRRINSISSEMEEAKTAIAEKRIQEEKEKAEQEALTTRINNLKAQAQIGGKITMNHNRWNDVKDLDITVTHLTDAEFILVGQALRKIVDNLPPRVKHEEEVNDEDEE